MNQQLFTYLPPLRPIAHSVWTQEVLRFMQFPPCTEIGLSFGIYLYSRIFYHTRPGVLIMHVDTGKDVTAIMERRGN
jgi:hypothetical protein